jgi:nucleoid DNA-binding protein
MNKAGITAKIADTLGLTMTKAKEAVEATFQAMKNILREGHSIDLGQLGTLRAVKLSRHRRVSRGLKNVGTSVFEYSKHAKTVKLNSKHDLSYEPLPAIVHPPPAKPVYFKSPCAVAFPRWRRSKTWPRSK